MSSWRTHTIKGFNSVRLRNDQQASNARIPERYGRPCIPTSKHRLSWWSQLVRIWRFIPVEPQTLPGPFPIDLDLERPTEERPDEHNQSKDANAGEGRVDRHAIDDVGGNQEFQSEYNGSSKIQTQT